MCIQHFFIKIEEVITSQGNENRSHLGQQAASYSDKKNVLKNTKQEKTVISMQVTMKNNNVHAVIINNFSKQTY